MEPKILFVKKFLAALCKAEIRTIPVNNQEFKAGIQNMADYYRDNVEKFGPYADQLNMLFIKYTTRGDFDQFSRIIENFNGRLISLESPYCIKANLKLEDDYIDDLVQDRKLGIGYEQFQQLVDCFRQGIQMA